MDIIAAIIIGIVQGLTEFLPVSSSAHLVLIPELLNINTTLAFDVTLHIGTLVAVIGYYWKDVIEILKAFFQSLKDLITGNFKEEFKNNQYKRLSWLLILGTIPVGLIGILFNDYIENAFNNIPLVACFLIITGFILLIAEKISSGTKDIEHTGIKDALLIGIGQACAILPGISRSGATISTSLLVGINREDAARFSFLMSIPAILGATLVEAKNIIGLLNADLFVILAGFLAAVISGYLAIKILLKVVRESSLIIFSIYCWIIGAAALIITFLI